MWGTGGNRRCPGPYNRYFNAEMLENFARVCEYMNSVDMDRRDYFQNLPRGDHYRNRGRNSYRYNDGDYRQGRNYAPYENRRNQRSSTPGPHADRGTSSNTGRREKDSIGNTHCHLDKKLTIGIAFQVARSENVFDSNYGLQSSSRKYGRYQDNQDDSTPRNSEASVKSEQRAELTSTSEDTPVNSENQKIEGSTGKEQSLDFDEFPPRCIKKFDESSENSSEANKTQCSAAKKKLIPKCSFSSSDDDDSNLEGPVPLLNEKDQQALVDSSSNAGSCTATSIFNLLSDKEPGSPQEVKALTDSASKQLKQVRLLYNAKNLPPYGAHDYNGVEGLLQLRVFACAFCNVWFFTKANLYHHATTKKHYLQYKAHIEDKEVFDTLNTI